MKSVKVKKNELISKLIENRAQHYVDFQKAFKGYEEECFRVLKENLKALKEKVPTRLYISEIAPEDHTKDYDRALAMLEMSVDEIVEILEKEFAQLVLDQWDWKQSWAVSNSKYLGYDQLEISK